MIHATTILVYLPWIIRLFVSNCAIICSMYPQTISFPMWHLRFCSLVLNCAIFTQSNYRPDVHWTRPKHADPADGTAASWRQAWQRAEERGHHGSSLQQTSAVYTWWRWWLTVQLATVAGIKMFNTHYTMWIHELGPVKQTSIVFSVWNVQVQCSTLTHCFPLELHLTTSELWFGQEQEGILP